MDIVNTAQRKDKCGHAIAKIGILFTQCFYPESMHL